MSIDTHENRQSNKRGIVAVIDGVEYKSVKSLAEALGVSDTTIFNYIRSEGDIYAACEKIKALKNSTIIYIYKGQEYPSLNALSEVTKMDRGVMKRVFDKHADEIVDGKLVVDDMLDEYLRQREESYTYHDKEYKSVRDAAKDLNMRERTLSKYLRLADGNLEKAMELYEESKVIAVIDDVKFYSQQEIAAALGVNKNKLSRYIQSEGSIEAAYRKLKSEIVTYTWNGVEYKSLNALAQAMDLPRVTLKRIMDNETNGDPIHAYELYMERSKGKYHGYEYRGVEYSTLKNMLSELGLSYKVYERLLPEYGDMTKTLDAMMEMAEQKRAQEDEKARLMQEKQNNKVSYSYEGIEYPTMAALSNMLGIPENSLRTVLMDVEKKGVVRTDSYVDSYLDSKYTYTYSGQTFPSIKALAEYTGIRELRLGRYIRKYDRDAEKAIMIIRERDKQQKKVKVDDAEFDLADLSTILGIKQSALRGFISKGMTIDEIKQHISNENSTHIVGGHRGATIMYDSTTSLLQYCVQNKLNYNCIYYAITEYGKSIEDAIKYYRNNGQRIPNSWIHERYDVLLKHLMLNENIDYQSIIAVMRNKQMSLRESLEYTVVRKDSKEANLDTTWQHEIYSLLTDPTISPVEREDMIDVFHVSPKEIQVVEKSRARVKELDRKLLVYELAECIRDRTFQDEEMAELMNLYEISDDELKTVFYDFYVNFRGGVLQTDIQQKRIEYDSRLKQDAKNRIEYFEMLMHGNKTQNNPGALTQETANQDAGDVEI
ncbi:MAG: hypothetical protein IKE91_07610 [Clostridia bacterium]|nr:hypothetical protein [Clostridia bacterium]